MGLMKKLALLPLVAAINCFPVEPAHAQGVGDAPAFIDESPHVLFTRCVVAVLGGTTDQCGEIGEDGEWAWCGVKNGHGELVSMLSTVWKGNNAEVSGKADEHPPIFLGKVFATSPTSARGNIFSIKFSCEVALTSDLRYVVTYRRWR